jgi:hypothetical protein
VLEVAFSRPAGENRTENVPGTPRGVNHFLGKESGRYAMPRSCIPLIAALLASAAIPPMYAAAQAIPSSFTFIEKKQEAGLYAGLVTAEKGRFGFGPSGGTAFGGRYAVELTGPLALEGRLGFVSGSRDIVNPGRVEGDQVVGEGDVLLTEVDAHIRFSFVGDRAWRGLAPFLSFGGGVVFDAADASIEEEDLEPADVFDFGTSFLGSAGLGTRWFLTETLALRLDGSFSLWGIDTPPGFSNPDRGFENVEESEWMSGLSFGVTLLYRW